MDLDSNNKRVFQKLGGPVDPKNQKVCFHWRASNCTRHPCPYLHRELPPPPFNGSSSKRIHGFVDDSLGFPGPRTKTNYTGSKWGCSHGGANSRTVRKLEIVSKICKYWVQGSCGYGEQCRFLHSRSLGVGFSMLTQLEGHQKVKSGSRAVRDGSSVEILSPSGMEWKTFKGGIRVRKMGCNGLSNRVYADVE